MILNNDLAIERDASGNGIATVGCPAGRKRKLAIAATVVVLLCLSIATWETFRRPEPLYQGKPASAWIEDAIFGDRVATEVIDRPHPADAMLGFDWERETSARALKFLKAKDNPFWKPYSGLKQRIPEAISKRLPKWREPKAARSAAVHFFLV